MDSPQIGGAEMTDTQRTKIKELRLAGYGYKKIAQALCLSVDTVKSYCRKNNLAGVMAGTPSSSVDGKTFCKQCGKELLQKPHLKTMLFCNKECRQTWWNAHPEMVKKKAIYSYLCPHCNKAFTAYGNSQRKYCSHSCYIADRFGGERHE
jgi:endogenous inhibitor of DNA gyrase (YacG/DUF329 family)